MANEAVVFGQALKEAGLNHNELRSLICQGLAEHLLEHTRHGARRRCFRPPQGLRSPWLMRVLKSDSLITVTWDDAPGDWDPISRETVARRAVLHARPGSIILLHDGLNLSHDIDRSPTVRALPEIIERLRSRGYRFVTVPEILHCPATLAGWHPAPGSPAS